MRARVSSSATVPLVMMCASARLAKPCRWATRSKNPGRSSGSPPVRFTDTGRGASAPNTRSARRRSAAGASSRLPSNASW